MKKWLAQLSAAGFLLSSGATAALADTITFDHRPCVAISQGVFPGNCYSSVGVSFASLNRETLTGVGQFAIAADLSATSSPNVARPLPGFAMLTVGFFIPPPGHGFGASAISFNVTGSRPGQNPWEAVFTGMESDMQRVVGTTDQLVSLSPAAVALHGPAFLLTFTTASASQGIDNLAIGADASVIADAPPSVTAEPATFLLIATGGVALLRRRRC